MAAKAQIFSWPLNQPTPGTLMLRASYAAAGIYSWTNRDVSRLARQLGKSFRELAELCGDREAVDFLRMQKEGRWTGIYGLHFDRLQRFIDARRFQSVRAAELGEADLASAQFLCSKNSDAS